MIPDPLATLALALGGLVAGSTLGLLADRLPHGEPVATVRSRCRACRTALGARDLVPILSWLASKGRCRHCGAPIGSAFALLEAGCLALALALAAVHPPGLALLAQALAAWLALACALADAHHRVVPAPLMTGLWVAGTAAGQLAGVTPLEAAVGAGACAATVGLAAVPQSLRRRAPALGGADVLLAGALGAWLGAGPAAGAIAVGAAAAYLRTRYANDANATVPLSAWMAGAGAVAAPLARLAS